MIYVISLPQSTHVVDLRSSIPFRPYLREGYRIYLLRVSPEEARRGSGGGGGVRKGLGSRSVVPHPPRKITKISAIVIYFVVHNDNIEFFFFFSFSLTFLFSVTVINVSSK